MSNTRKPSRKSDQTLLTCDKQTLAEAEQIIIEIRALRRELLRSPSEEGEHAGVTGPQRSVIACIVARGPMTVTEISRAAGMSHSTASGIVDRLEVRGFLRRTDDVEDRRRTQVTVTPTVTKYVRQLDVGPFGRLATGLANASPRERQTIRKGLGLLRRILGENVLQRLGET
jgi:DNA-binding MarR family transcriptional regulator